MRYIAGCRQKYYDGHDEISEPNQSYQNRQNKQKQTHELATKEEIQYYRSIAGAVLWIGGGGAVISKASYVTSMMPQKVTRLHVSDIIEANSILHELRNLTPRIRYKATRRNNCTFLEPSLNISSQVSYEQTGIISALVFERNGRVIGPFTQ